MCLDIGNLKMLHLKFFQHSTTLLHYKARLTDYKGLKGKEIVEKVKFSYLKGEKNL